MTKDNYLGAIIGSACGDALGRATEFMKEKDIVNYYGYKITTYEPDRLGVFQYGEITDDSYLMLCIANSLIENKIYDINDIKYRFIDWYKYDGRDCGNQTASSIDLMIDGFEAIDSGKHSWEKTGKTSAGNGGLMRNIPIPLAYINNYEYMIEVTKQVCKMTHYDKRCVISCIIHSMAIYCILNNIDAFDFIWNKLGQIDSELDNVILEAKDSKIKNFILDKQNMGYTYLSLKVALCALFNYNNYEEPIYEIVNKGGDADTNACIAGSLLGAKFGYNSIPKELTDNLLQFSSLYKVAEELYEFSKGI